MVREMSLPQNEDLPMSFRIDPRPVGEAEQP
jgi:hypothetical protein